MMTCPLQRDFDYQIPKGKLCVVKRCQYWSSKAEYGCLCRLSAEPTKAEIAYYKDMTLDEMAKAKSEASKNVDTLLVAYTFSENLQRVYELPDGLPRLFVTNQLAKWPFNSGFTLKPNVYWSMLSPENWQHFMETRKLKSSLRNHSRITFCQKADFAAAQTLWSLKNEQN